MSSNFVSRFELEIIKRCNLVNSCFDCLLFFSGLSENTDERDSHRQRRVLLIHASSALSFSSPWVYNPYENEIQLGNAVIC